MDLQCQFNRGLFFPLKLWLNQIGFSHYVRILATRTRTGREVNNGRSTPGFSCGGLVIISVHRCSSHGNCIHAIVRNEGFNISVHNSITGANATGSFVCVVSVWEGTGCRAQRNPNRSIISRVLSTDTDRNWQLFRRQNPIWRKISCHYWWQETCGRMSILNRMCALYCTKL